MDSGESLHIIHLIVGFHVDEVAVGGARRHPLQFLNPVNLLQQGLAVGVGLRLQVEVSSPYMSAQANVAPYFLHSIRPILLFSLM